MATAATAEPSPPNKTMSPLPRELRLSPRCILNPSGGAGGGEGDSSSSRGVSPFGAGGQRAYSSSQSSLLTTSSSLDLSFGGTTGSGGHLHFRQGSTTSAEFDLSHGAVHPPPMALHKSYHSRQSSGGTTTSADSGAPQHNNHSRQHSLEIGGARRKTSLASSGPRNSATPPSHKMPPFSAMPSKVSPTSLDMGYHTMMTNTSNGGDSSSPYNSMDLSSPCPTNVVKPKPPEVPFCFSDDSAVCSLDASSLSVKYNSSSSLVRGSSSPFDLLPDNVLLNILSYLPTNSLCQTASVSRRFYFLSWDPSLWNDIDLSGDDKLNLDLALVTCLKIVCRSQRTSLVQRVRLNGCSRLSDVGLSAVATRCPELRQLTVKRAPNVTNSGVMEIVKGCPSLTHLDLTGKTPTSPNPALLECSQFFRANLWMLLTAVSFSFSSGSS